MRNQKFFGGEASNLGLVRELPPRDFQGLVEQYLNAPVQLNLTRTQFFALEGGHANSPRDLAKRVPYLVPASFRESPSKRLTANAQGVSLIFLDIDPEKDKSGKEISYPAAPYIKDPQILARQLDGLNYAVYHTAQSQPGAPRIRVMVEGSGFAPELYRQAVSHVAKLIGLPFVTSESGVVVQAMFRPTSFSDTNHEKEHPLIAWRADASPLTAEDFAGADNTTPTAGKTTAARTSNEDTSGDALEFLRPPVEGVTLDDCKDALLHIDADIEYRAWLEIAAGLKHQFPRGKESDAALELFDTWSAEGEKYKGQEDTQAKWDSFRPSPVGRVPVTIRSLFRRATESGWNNAEAKQRGYNSTREFIRATTTLTGLLSDALDRIITTPLLSASEEEGLLYEILRHAKEKFEHRTNLPTLKKDLKRKKANIEATRKIEKEKDTPAPPWAMGLCYVEKINEFYRFSNRAALGPEPLDSAYSRFLLPSKEALEASGQANSPAAASKPVVRPRDFILNLLKVRTAYDYLYDPRCPDDQFVTSQGRLYVNTYHATHPEPDPTLAKEAGEIFSGHIDLLIAEPEHRKTFLDFLAFLVQNPGQKIRWAPLIQSVKGAGKGFIETVMRTVLGGEQVKRVDPGTLFKDWTDWAYGTQLTVLNEIRVKGHSRFDIMNKLKEPVSDDWISIQQRFRDHREVENLVNYMMFTNFHDAIAIEEDERRYFVVKSPLQRKSQLQELRDKGHFDKIFGMLKTHAGGLRSWFEDYEISADFPVDGPAPVTKYLGEMTEDTAPELNYTIEALLASKDHPLVSEDLISVGVLQSLLAQEGLTKSTPQQLTAVLRSLGYNRADRVSIDGQRHVLWAHVESGLDGLDLAKIAAKLLASYAASEADKMFENEGDK